MRDEYFVITLVDGQDDVDSPFNNERNIMAAINSALRTKYVNLSATVHEAMVSNGVVPAFPTFAVVGKGWVFAWGGGYAALGPYNEMTGVVGPTVDYTPTNIGTVGSLMESLTKAVYRNHL